MDEIKLDAVDAVIPRRRACRIYLGVSPTTAWRREHKDPTWPKPVEMSGGNRVGYLASDISRYISGLAERPPPGA